MHSSDTTTICADITNELTKLPTAQLGRTIYKVHDHLRDVNRSAYEPEIIAIGPYHCDKVRLKMMEDHKIRYLRTLDQRKPGNLEKYVSAIEQLEDQARNCYAEPINLTPKKFTKMLVLDGCFIIELVGKFTDASLRENNDPIFNMNWIRNSLRRDLMLFENQIPFFILCKLLDLIFEVPSQHNTFMYQVLVMFHSLLSRGVRIQTPDRSPDTIKHLLDLIHKELLPSHQLLDWGKGRSYTENPPFINSTAKLRMANVKFKRKEGATLFDVSFKNGTLFLAPLKIADSTESFFRNLIVYEQYFLSETCFVTDYMTLMDGLIDSSRDVEILSNCRVINNLLGDDEVVANMFNKLLDSVVVGNHFLHAKLIDDVNIHCDKFINKWMTKLRRNYWNSPWVVLAILLAAVLVLLTVTQTVFTILQVVL